MKKNQLELTFTSLPGNVGIARMLIASVAAQLDLALSDIEELKVATSEAVSNSIIHGYKNKEDKPITLRIEYDEKQLKILVKDHGCGIPDIQQAMQPAYSTDPERMGLGFVFMQSFMDDLQVESTVNEGTTVLMVKELENIRPSKH